MLTSARRDLIAQIRSIDNSVCNSVKSGFIEFINEYPDCYLRSCLHGHLTASVFVLNSDLSKALLMHHRKLGIWVQPGGHADGETNLLEVAKKELFEEANLSAVNPMSTEIFDISIHKIPARINEPAHLHYDVIFLFHSTDDNFKHNHEAKAMAWVDLNDYSGFNLTPAVARLFTKAKQYTNQVAS